jgi:GTP-binding protein HflX
MKRRIVALESELDELEKNRMTMRASRDKSQIPQIAIVGYTNAGKSTLLNTLTDAGILAENKLFATLDPTTRKLKLPCGETVLLTDTVGFIRKLPHHLVKAFKSTLDEAVYADILMIVIDAHDDEARAQLDVTESLLAELGAAGKPTIYVYNKCDLGISPELPSYIANNEDPNRVVCAISAKSGEGIDILLEKVEEIIHQGKSKVTFVIPNSEQGALNILYKNATVENVEYGYEGVTVVATVDQKVRGMLKKYDVNRPQDVEEF